MQVWSGSDLAPLSTAFNEQAPLFLNYEYTSLLHNRFYRVALDSSLPGRTARPDSSSLIPSMLSVSP